MDTGIIFNGIVINNLRYADDTIIFTSTEQERQMLLNKISYTGYSKLIVGISGK